MTAISGCGEHAGGAALFGVLAGIPRTLGGEGDEGFGEIMASA